jgi:hypothetical protein
VMDGGREGGREEGREVGTGRGHSTVLSIKNGADNSS